MSQSVLGVPDVAELFATEVERVGGRITDMFADATRLFARSVLKMRTEVRYGDVVEGGVAVRVAGQEVWVRPYLFRLACGNGAIMATSDEAEHLDLATLGDVEHQREHVQAAIACCGSQDTFLSSSGSLRALATYRPDTALTAMSMLVRHLNDVPNNTMLDIMEHLRMESDRGAFGIMNAVTAVARDTRDPEHRWRLEEIGGGVPAMLVQPDRVRPHAERWAFDSAVVDTKVPASLK
jgi:hypothetical protein